MDGLNLPHPLPLSSHEQECVTMTDELWAEHGWGLTGWQTGAILGVVALASIILSAVG